MKKESTIAQRERRKTSKIKIEDEEKQSIANEKLKNVQQLKESALAAIDCIDKL